MPENCKREASLTRSLPTRSAARHVSRSRDLAVRQQAPACRRFANLAQSMPPQRPEVSRGNASRRRSSPASTQLSILVYDRRQKKNFPVDCRIPWAAKRASKRTPIKRFSLGREPVHDRITFERALELPP